MKDKLTDFIVLAILIGLAVVIGLRVSIPVSKTLGIPTNEETYRSVTNSSTTCAITANGTLIITTSTGRTSFIVSNLGPNAISVCKDAVCTQGAGIQIYPSSTPFIQTDGYIGPYSCAASVASSAVSYAASP
jgi:hypothetical protein